MVTSQETTNVISVEVPENPGPGDILEAITEFTEELYGLVYGADEY